jgi:hypothetical protein
MVIRYMGCFPKYRRGLNSTSVLKTGVFEELVEPKKHIAVAVHVFEVMI